MLPEAIMDYVMNKRDRGRQGNHDEVMAPHNVYRCRGEDKWMAIAVDSEEEWQNLCRAVGHPEWLADKRFTDRRSRKAHEQELDALLTAWTRDKESVLRQYQELGVERTVFGVPSAGKDTVLPLVDKYAPMIPKVA